MQHQKTRTVYIPTSNNSKLKVGTIDNDDYYKSFNSEATVEEKEGYFFTPEEYKNRLIDFGILVSNYSHNDMGAMFEQYLEGTL